MLAMYKTASYFTSFVSYDGILYNVIVALHKEYIYLLFVSLFL